MNRIAICFFGITRSLSYTIRSIEENVLDPARRVGETRIFAHFFRQRQIDNPRSGEKGILPQDEHYLIRPDWLELEDPDRCLTKYAFEELKDFGDAWNDGGRSLRNLIHQLHSMHRVTQEAMKWQPDVIMFVRPDLLFHDSIGRALKVRRPMREEIYIPRWQNWHGGYNDRFAVCYSRRVADIYGNRVERVGEFCNIRGEPLHAERFLKYVLDSSNLQPRFMHVRASRVRLDGKVRSERFIGPLEENIQDHIRHWANKAGVLPALRKLRDRASDK